MSYCLCVHLSFVNTVNSTNHQEREIWFDILQTKNILALLQHRWESQEFNQA